MCKDVEDRFVKIISWLYDLSFSIINNSESFNFESNEIGTDMKDPGENDDSPHFVKFKILKEFISVVSFYSLV